MSDAQIVCAGIIVADHVCTPITHVPAAGELVMAEKMLLTIGGCAANAAVDLAKMGARAAVVGRVGDDDFGREFASLLGRERIHAEHLRVTSDRPTGAGFIIKNPAGANMITVDMGANQLLDERDLLADGRVRAECWS